VRASLERRRGELPAAERLVADETARYAAWLAGLSAVPVLTQFRARADELRARELENALRRIGDLTPAQRSALEHFSRALMNKFLHEPSVRLRAAAAEAQGLDAAAALRYLFALDESAPVAANEREDADTDATPASLAARTIHSGDR
jgi:glutamyl-tRNA reductase